MTGWKFWVAYAVLEFALLALPLALFGVIVAYAVSGEAWYPP